MTYAVKEIYYTLQGEGANAGRPAVFCALPAAISGPGLEKDREKGPGGCSRWCDTNFVGTDGPGGGKFKSADDLAAAVIAPGRRPATTAGRLHGGEPLLQFDAALVAAFHDKGFEVAVETNGTQPATPGLDWICVSPKAGAEIVLTSGDELKLVFPQPDAARTLRTPAVPASLPAAHGRSRARAQHAARGGVLQGAPGWRLSVQAHKYLGIP